MRFYSLVHHMLRLLIFLISAMLCASAVGAFDYRCIDPVVETRAIWVDAGAIPQTPEGIRQLVADYRRANINLLFPEIIARGYAIYPSKLLARDPRFANAPDVLALLIAEAHAAGIEVHPWVWVFRAGYTKDKGAILGTHPDWTELSQDGKELSPNGGYWISPVVPEARDFLAELFAELVREYDIDGLHLDYIRYESETAAPYGYSELSRTLFRRQYGVDPFEIDKYSFHRYEWQKFRERQINTFVQRIALQTRSLKPHVMLSAAVGADPKTARLHLMQNWQNWVDNKWIDFVVPMVYTNNDQNFRSLVTIERDLICGRTLLVPGISIMDRATSVERMTSQIGIARELQTAGESLFASSYFQEANATTLSAGPYARPTKLPFREPWVRSQELCDRAVQLRKEGKEDEAGFLADRSVMLANYAKYLETEIPYVLPTPPPLDIPEFVVPLPRVEIPRTSLHIRIDGKLDDAAWRSATAVKLSYTNTGAPAQVDTTAYLTWDESNLYIAFECNEPEVEKIKAKAAVRDEPTFYDDSVEIFIDPTGNRRSYFHISTNTIETRYDAKLTNPNWNGEWKTATKVENDKWTTEIAIPFSTLGASEPTIGSEWAINLARNRTTSGNLEYLTWAVPYGSFHTPDRFGTIVFR